MAQSTLDNGEARVTHRTKINDNFTEVYGNIDAQTIVSVNGAVVLTSTAYGKIHVLVDIETPADYTVTLPTAASFAGKCIAIKGAAALTKVVTIACNGVQTIDGYTTRKIAKHGLFVVMSDGTNLVMVNEVGSWIPFTAHNTTGFSAAPTVAAKYFRVGKNVIYEYTTSANGTSDATTLTVDAPFPAKTAKTEECMITTTSSVIAIGRYIMTAGSVTIQFFVNLAGNAFTASGTKATRFTINYEME